MKNSKLGNPAVIRVVLLLSGLIATGVAAGILIAPDAFYAPYGIELDGNTNLTNELKAPAGLLLVLGATILAGAVRAQLITVSTTTAAAVFLSFGLSRVLSMIVDGMPHDGLVSAAVVEIAVGAICLITLILQHKRSTTK